MKLIALEMVLGTHCHFCAAHVCFVTPRQAANSGNRNQ